MPAPAAEAAGGCSVFGLVDERADRDADELFTAAALVAAHQLHRGRLAQQPRRLEACQALRVLRRDEPQPGLPPPSHASRIRVPGSRSPSTCPQKTRSRRAALPLPAFLHQSLRPALRGAREGATLL